MALLRREIKLIPSREDYDLFRAVFHSFNPLLTLNIHLRIAPGQLIKSGVPFATVIPFNSSPDNDHIDLRGYELALQQSGRVQSIGQDFAMVQGSSEYTIVGKPKGNLTLFYFRQCQHQPGGESFLRASDLTQSTARGFHNLCIHCSKPLQIYYQPQEEEITLEKFLLANNHFFDHQKLPELEWTVILNEQFTPTVSIAQVDGQNLNLPYVAKPTFLLNFQEYGKKLKSEMIVMKIKKLICRHEKLIEGRCQYCMQQIKVEEARHYATYLFQMDQGQNSSMLVKGQALKQQQQEFIDGLMKNNKAIMILDLDNTILHSSQMSDLEPETVLALNDYYLIRKMDFSPHTQQVQLREDYIVVKMRPYFKHFLFEMDRLFQIYVYTKGTRMYAEQICKFVRAQYAGQPISTYHKKTWIQTETFLVESRNFQQHRIISRDEDSNLETKSMQKILPSKKQYHIILDDRRDVWKNSPSWYYTQQYTYFNKRQRPQSQQPRSQIDVSYLLENVDVDIPQLKSSLMEDLKLIKKSFPQKKNVLVETINKPDYFLLFAAHALGKLHKTFFQYKRNANAKDTKDSNEKEQVEPRQRKDKESKDGKEVKEEIDKSAIYYLQHRLKLFFSRKKMRFIIPGEDPHGTIRRAQKLGVVILPAESEELPKFVIRSVNFITELKTYKIRKEASKQSEKIEKQQDIKIEKQIVKQEEKKLVLISSTYNYESEFQKLKRYIQLKIPIISQTWIQTCYELNYSFPHERFIMANPLEEGQDRKMIDQTIEIAALQIRKEIEAKIQKDSRKA